MKVGVIHGRFQMLHLGHMEYLLEGMNRCERLVIGICNPDPDMSSFSVNNPHRSSIIANPLTYFERMEIIKQAMLDSGINQSKFDIVPFPINFPDKIKYYVPKDAIYFMTIYDAWSIEKKIKLEQLGYQVEVMWKRDNSQKLTSGSEVRNKIAKGEEWKYLVPNATYTYIKKYKIDQRIVVMYNEFGGDGNVK